MDYDKIGVELSKIHNTDQFKGMVAIIVELLSEVQRLNDKIAEIEHGMAKRKTKT